MKAYLQLLQSRQLREQKLEAFVEWFAVAQNWQFGAFADSRVLTPTGLCPTGT